MAGFPTGATLVTFVCIFFNVAVTVTEGSLSVSTEPWFTVLEEIIHEVFKVGEINTWSVCSLKAQPVRFGNI